MYKNVGKEYVENNTGKIVTVKEVSIEMTETGDKQQWITYQYSGDEDLYSIVLSHFYELFQTNERVSMEKRITELEEEVKNLKKEQFNNRKVYSSHLLKSGDIISINGRHFEFEDSIFHEDNIFHEVEMGFTFGVFNINPSPSWTRTGNTFSTKELNDMR